MNIENTKGKKILTIDDDKSIRVSFKNYLEDYEYIVEDAENGQKGIEKIKSFQPDVVLVDLRMPEVDGLQVLDAVKAMDEKLPIIVISGTGEIAEVVEALRKGAWDYILKPVQDMDVVVHSIEKVWERARLLRTTEEHHQQLEQEVERRTRELSLANEDLKAFDYSVSNALRVPLRHAAGFCGILLEDHFEQLDDNGKSFLKRIVNSVAECRNMIDELLKMSRVTWKELKKEELNLSVLARKEFNKVKQEHEATNAEIQVDSEFIENVDSVLICFAFSIIFDNSLKYSRNEESSRIVFGIKEFDGKKAYFIQDNGRGFEPGRVEKIFEPFHSYHTDSDFTGAGLGLATAERIIERHGGEIWAQSEKGKGTTIFFTLE